MSINPNPLDDKVEPPRAYRSQRSGSERDLHAEPDITHTLADLRKQVQTLTQQLDEERQLNQKLMALNTFAQNLQNAPDFERVAQTMADSLSQIAPCDLICIFHIPSGEQRFKLLATAGLAAYLAPHNYQPDQTCEVIQQALDSQTMLTSQSLPKSSPMELADQHFPSLLAAPLVRNGVLRGLILLAHTSALTFEMQEQRLISAAGEQLLNVWEYTHQAETLTEFVQTVTLMSVVQEAGSLMEMIASIARRTLSASFALVVTRGQQEWHMRGAGRAPRLLHSLKNNAASFLEEAIRSPYTFRLQDLRKDPRAARLQPDSEDLCSLLASPIRINGTTTGILLAFGKTGGKGFNDGDVFLAELLVSHAAVNLESCYLNQELRANLKSTQLFHDLSLNVAQAGNLTDAAYAIARTAYRLLQAHQCGLLLLSTDGQVEAEVRFPSDDESVVHPYHLIQQAMDSRQTIYLSDEDNLTFSAAPIQTLRRCYGALWMEFTDGGEETRRPTDEIHILINQAAVALERSILLEETRQQAEKIDRAYQDLKTSYEDLLYGLIKALDARDRDTEDHSKRVEELSVKVGIEMGLGRKELQALKRGALLHDIGKIGIPDVILHKAGPLDDQEWEKMRQHPQKGVEIIEKIHELQDAIPVIAYHQERWDGSGYPAHLKNTEIPLLARIFAVVDVFDALTSLRPYRTAQSYEEALLYLESQSGIHFDPEVVIHFCQIVRTNLHLFKTPHTGELPNLDE